MRVGHAAGVVLLDVEDNGPGIPPERLPAVRQRFARGESEAPGLGLGLPIVEEIAVRFEGRLSLGPAVTAEGKADHGLKARVTFPAIVDGT